MGGAAGKVMLENIAEEHEEETPSPPHSHPLTTPPEKALPNLLTPPRAAVARVVDYSSNSNISDSPKSTHEDHMVSSPGMNVFFQEMQGLNSQSRGKAPSEVNIDSSPRFSAAERKVLKRTLGGSFKMTLTNASDIRHDISDDSDSEKSAQPIDEEETSSTKSITVRRIMNQKVMPSTPQRSTVTTASAAMEGGGGNAASTSPVPRIRTSPPHPGSQSRPNGIFTSSIPRLTTTAGTISATSTLNSSKDSQSSSKEGTIELGALPSSSRSIVPPRGTPQVLTPLTGRPSRGVAAQEEMKKQSPTVSFSKGTLGAVPRSPTHAMSTASGSTSARLAPATPRTAAAQALLAQQQANGPRPSGKVGNVVIETSDVKRNTVQLPSTLTHARPTTGDWLKQRYIVNNYILLDTLGNGSYGVVRMCKDRITDHLYAIKIISRDMLRKKKSGHTTETFLADIQREIAIMKKLDHPNVLRLFEVLDDPKVNKLYLVLEYMKKGDLINVLKTREGVSEIGKEAFIPLSDRQLWNIFRQVVSGVIYLHYQNIVHGDIKPQNLLVGEDGVVKIADFGISKILDTSGDKVLDAAGTPAFMSPELCGGLAYDGHLADVWAIGATMYMLKFGAPPFLASNVLSLYYKIQNDPLVFPFPINANLRDLFEKMLDKVPSERFTMAQVSAHIWLLQPPLYSSSEQTAMSAQEEVNQKAMFHPPQSYSKAHEVAMSNPLSKQITHKDIFMSIGVGVESGDNECSKATSNDGAAEAHDIMKTDWGVSDGVFEAVSGDVESDSDDEDETDKEGGRAGKGSRDSHGSGESKDESDSRRRLSNSSTKSRHEEMSEQEEESRRKKFQYKQQRKSFNEAVVVKSAASSSKKDIKNLGKGGIPAGTPRVEKKLALPPSTESVPKLDQDYNSDGEDAKEITFDDMSSLLDTLGRQPRHPLEDSAEVGNFTLNMAEITADVTNAVNGISAAYNSEQGARASQEDRCVLYPDMYAFIKSERLGSGREMVPEDTYFKSVSMACIFDGHNGGLTAHLLTERFARVLIVNDKFTKKQWKDALLETFRKVDEEICKVLAENHDSSGSTAVVIIFDGNKNVLTVANVGDSRCILSRAGRAVNLHRLHRLTESDERERVLAAGGKVIRSRVNGVLAISRAFGDIEFKGSNPLHGLVVAVPDIHVERITPMTEFLLLGTDGLFDVMEGQSAVNTLRCNLQATSSLQRAAKALSREAISKGSVDNVTVAILSFHANAVPNENN